MSLLKSGKILYERVNGSDLEETKTGLQFSHNDEEISEEQIQNVLGDLKLSDMKHDFWKRFGFQNINPRTDFRASGILGLH